MQPDGGTVCGGYQIKTRDHGSYELNDASSLKAMLKIGFIYKYEKGFVAAIILGGVKISEPCIRRCTQIERHIHTNRACVYEV
jgi:hypothetical protein